MIEILWASKTGNANAWYHIAPFSFCSLVKKVHVVRYKKPLRDLKDVDYHTFSSQNKFLDIIYYIFKIIKVLSSRKIDVVVAFNPYPWGLISFTLAKLFKKPIILGLIGGELDANRTPKYKRTLLSFLLKYVDIVTVTGDKTKKQLLDSGLKKNNVYVFPHLVDKNYLSKVKKRVTKSNIITITSFLPVKRTQDTIKSIALLKKQGLNLKMVILGDGPHKNNCMKLAESLGVEKNIIFEGYVDDIRPYINSSEYYLQTSSSEGLSISLIESMAVGLIPIATNVGDEQEIIHDNQTGVFVPVGNPQIIANKIAHLESSPIKNKLKINIEKKIMKSKIELSDKYISEILEFIK